MATTALVWFRRDLRVHDHPPLRAALDACERVVPVFVLDDKLLHGRHASGSRTQFMLESLRELRTALQERGGNLVIARGTPEAELTELAREHEAKAVSFASDASPFAMARDRRVEAALREAGVQAHRTPGNFVADIGKPKPYLHFGCVSPRELEARADGHDAYTRQLAWRDFYAHVLLHHPDNAHQAYRRELDGIEWDGEDAHFDAWREGRTGYPVVDAGMRQLATTGWMHNRARLITACFLVKDLHIDWRRGEQHFIRLLLDGDQANNNGNWQWIAGGPGGGSPPVGVSVGVDPAPLHRRLYNPVLQQQRHDPDGEYVRRWVPELEDIPLEKLATPWEAGGPEPIVDHAVERRRTLAAYAAARGS